MGTIKVDFGVKDHQIAALSVYNTIAAAVGCVLGDVIPILRGRSGLE
jgi:hypothetical protein